MLMPITYVLLFPSMLITETLRFGHVVFASLFWAFILTLGVSFSRRNDAL